MALICKGRPCSKWTCACADPPRLRRMGFRAADYAQKRKSETESGRRERCERSGLRWRAR